uniref:Spiralian-TALE-D homeobox protein n=1 Tax=Nipponacmea fuscoviridis TaxID=225302 RepID=A0A1L7NS61_9GAST|nr:spiralian-TALE-D homeobox protein [Nipponacmea fuscoviridis]
MASIVDYSPNSPQLTKCSEYSRLSSHPMFTQLQATLLSECFQQELPYSLIDDNVPAVPAPKSQLSDVVNLDSAMIAVQEANLQADFRQLSMRGDVRVSELQTFYYGQCSQNETRRTEAVTELKAMSFITQEELKEKLTIVHEYYDKERLQLTNRVTGSLQLLKACHVPVPNKIVYNKSRSRQLNPKAIQVMNEWYNENLESPYPNDEEKILLADKGGISLAQVKAWFANKRNRSSNTKPKRQKQQVEKRLLNICTELTSSGESGGKSPKMYGEIIQQLSDIVNGANVFNQSYNRNLCEQ